MVRFQWDRILTQFFYKLVQTRFRDIIINRNEFVYEIFDGEKILCIVKKKKDWGGKDRFDDGKKERDLVKRGWKSSRNSCRKIYILLPRNHGFLECRGEESFRTLVETTRFPMKEINKTQAAKLWKRISFRGNIGFPSVENTILFSLFFLSLFLLRSRTRQTVLIKRTRK